MSEELLTRGVQAIYPSAAALKQILARGKKLRIYSGIDPTGKLHIGHGAILQKLRDFQSLGHELVVLLGDFTAQIGDPTDKLSSRRSLTPAEIKKHRVNYKKIINRVLDLTAGHVRFLSNADWLDIMKLKDFLSLASNFTVAQLLERDMFQKRITAGKQIYLHEFLYPLFQAYDAVAIDVDLEIGGNDQTFNMLAGRTLMKKLKGKEKFVLATKLLIDPQGKKMGKTEGQTVNLDDNPCEMFGKIMAWPDGLIKTGFELCTRLPLVGLDKKITEEPMRTKKELAREIVKIYHGEKAARAAEDYWVKTFSVKDYSSLVKTLPAGDYQAADLVKKMRPVSGSQAFRLIRAGALVVNGRKIVDPKQHHQLKAGDVVSLGKKDLAKVVKT